MDLKLKRKTELNNQKEQRKNEVIAAALEVFKTKGIETSKMIDIAAKAEIGIATVYRYFRTKQELVIEAATFLWESEMAEVYKEFIDNNFKLNTGIDRVKGIFRIFIRLYEEHHDFIKFVNEFDNYIVKEEISPDMLAKYESYIITLKSITIDAIVKGKNDGSIDININENDYYITVTHYLMSLCQKLVLRGHILKSDVNTNGRAELELAIDIAINYLKANQKG